MRILPKSPRTIRWLLAGGGLLVAAFGFFCLSEVPKRLVLDYFSQDDTLNNETMAAFILMGSFFAIFGWGAAAIALLWPRLIERAIALPRTEFFYYASLFGSNLLVFFGLVLGRQSMTTYDIVLAIVVAGTLLFLLELKISRQVAAVYTVIFNRWTAFIGYFAAGTFFFALRFPFSTWNRYLFGRDYPMFQYTALLDLGILKRGALYGWEPNFSCGYPTFLNLRSILIPYLPFSFLPPPVAFHVMLFVTYIIMPYLVYWVAKVISEDRDMAIFSGWAAVGAMAGYMWHILLWGMAPTFESVPFLVLALGFFIKAVKGSRWGVFLAALCWTPVAYIHFGHFAHVGLALLIPALVYSWEHKSLRPVLALAKVTVLAAVLACPYLVQFYAYRNHVILTNMYSYPDETLLGMVRALLTTVSHFIPTMIWDWRGYFAAKAFPDYGYFALFTIYSLVVAYLFLSGDKSKRAAAALYAGAIIISALSFLPKFQLSFQRMLYMVPPLMAIATGFWMGEAKKRGHMTPLYVFIVISIFYTRPLWIDNPLVPELRTIAERGAFDPAVVDRARTLGGNYVLYEDTASLNPYVDLTTEFRAVPEEVDVHSEAFMHMATGKRLFSHPGYNPHPYYDLRWTYIATGTYLGKDISEYPPSFFGELFRKWGVEYVVAWSKAAKAYFEKDVAYEEVLQGGQYTIYRFSRADPRAVVTEGGGGEVSYGDNFSAAISLQGVKPGGRVVLRANYFPQWRAQCDGHPVALQNYEGQIAFAAPASDCTVVMRWPHNRGLLLIPPLGLIVGLALSASRKL